MYKMYTDHAGSLSRHLALIGGGLVWLFHEKISGSENVLLVNLDCLLGVALTLICLSLLIDVVQALIGSLLWYKAFNKAPAGEAQDSKCPIYFANSCISIKLILMCLAYILLIFFLFKTPLI